MINDYKQAAVIELGRAQDLVLGNKKLCWDCIDPITGQFGTRVIDIFDVND